MLPTGARIRLITLVACKTNPAANVTAQLLRFPKPEGSPVSLASVSTSEYPNVTGCNFFAALLSAAETIDNHFYNYHLQVAINGTGIDDRTRFSGVEIFYRLQVSPAPATATFADVPTNHPFFPFIEALVAAGITSGCSASPLMYCPDNPITRGQMARFLSTALGLQFAP
jgi:hypothetical protein